MKYAPKHKRSDQDSWAGSAGERRASRLGLGSLWSTSQVVQLYVSAIGLASLGTELERAGRGDSGERHLPHPLARPGRRAVARSWSASRPCII